MVQGDKEGKITTVPLSGITPTLFSSQLANGQTRKRLSVYNNSNTASGESYYSYSAAATVSASSMAIPVGSMLQIPVSSDIPVYFFCKSGEKADLRVEEIA